MLEEYFERLSQACRSIADDFGEWPDKCKFDALGDLVEEVIASGGLYFIPEEDGQMRIEIPFTLDTMPHFAAF